MEWNNGKERAKFEREQRKLREEYLALGMTEEQIQEMYKFDLKWFNSRRTEARHTQSLDIDTSEDDEIKKDSPLYKKFSKHLSSNLIEETSRRNWIEEIDNDCLYKAIQHLSEKDKNILYDLFYVGLSQTEIAAKIGVKKAAISRKISRLKKFLKNFF